MAELSSVAVLVTVCATACVSIIHAIQSSKCVEINMCCMKCIRKVPDVEEPIEEKNLND